MKTRASMVCLVMLSMLAGLWGLSPQATTPVQADDLPRQTRQGGWLDAVVFVPESAPAAKLAQLRAYGAQVLAVRGNYDVAYDLCLAACDHFGWYNRSTGYNPFTREGKKTCAFELWEDLGRRIPDRVVVPTGDGNIISGIWKGWRDLKAVGLIDRLPQIDCAQSAESGAICRTVRRLRSSGQAVEDWSRVTVDEVAAATAADSICVDRPRDGLAAVRAVMESGGEAVTVAEGEISGAAFDIRDNETRAREGIETPRRGNRIPSHRRG